MTRREYIQTLQVSHDQLEALITMNSELKRVIGTAVSQADMINRLNMYTDVIGQLAEMGYISYGLYPAATIFCTIVTDLMDDEESSVRAQAQAGIDSMEEKATQMERNSWDFIEIRVPILEFTDTVNNCFYKMISDDVVLLRVNQNGSWIG